MGSQPLQALQDTVSPSPFLRVEKSARGYKWVERLDPALKNTSLAISQTHGITDILARVLTARGSTLDTVANDLNPTLKNLMPDPSSLQDMDKAAERFIR